MNSMPIIICIINFQLFLYIFVNENIILTVRGKCYEAVTLERTLQLTLGLLSWSTEFGIWNKFP